MERVRLTRREARCLLVRGTDEEEGGDQGTWRQHRLFHGVRKMDSCF